MTRPTPPRAIGEIPSWDAEADVVVVGLGCAGAAAVIEAQRAGAEVLVLERAGGGGGTSALSGGIVYCGGGTPVQKKCGFEDSPEEMYRYLMASCGPGPDEAKIRLYCERSVEHFGWLVEQGVPFKESFYPDGGGEPPTDDGLVFSGSENVHPFDRIARPAPRGHCPRIEGPGGGLLMRALLEAAAHTDAKLRTDSRCETLVVDRERRVVGAVVRSAGREHRVRARRGVILASGGFIYNDEMVARYAPLLARCSYRVGTEGDDGSGIRMGMGAGGAAIRMDAGDVTLPYYPPHGLMRGVLVNRHGQRFINEDAYYGRVGEFALLRQEGVAYLIVDDGIFARPRAGMEVAAVGETPAELERELGMPEGSLQGTLELYNRHAARGEDPLFHKSRALLRPLETPPLGALDCTTENAIYAAFTLGGLHTDTGGGVLTPDGEVVRGLYAAGRTTSGLSAQGYSSGISIADGTFFGRRAGVRAARDRDA
jgi:3-oxo-5alpha-steroid 4-dehydrogenase